MTAFDLSPHKRSTVQPVHRTRHSAAQEKRLKVAVLISVVVIVVGWLAWVSYFGWPHDDSFRLSGMFPSLEDNSDRLGTEFNRLQSGMQARMQQLETVVQSAGAQQQVISAMKERLIEPTATATASTTASTTTASATSTTTTDSHLP